MKHLIHQLVRRGTTASILFFASSSVWAGAPNQVGTLTYGPVPPIPTLSGMMLVVLALLLATVGYRMMTQKENNAGRMMVLSLIAVGAMASGLGGVKLINDAYAINGGGGNGGGEPQSAHDMTNATGGVLPINRYGNSYTNQTDSPLMVLGIDLGGSYCHGGNCEVGKTIRPGDSCNLGGCDAGHDNGGG